jgi:hypothetical protein
MDECPPNLDETCYSQYIDMVNGLAKNRVWEQQEIQKLQLEHDKKVSEICRERSYRDSSYGSIGAFKKEHPSLIEIARRKCIENLEASKQWSVTNELNRMSRCWYIVIQKKGFDSTILIYCSSSQKDEPGKPEIPFDALELTRVHQFNVKLHLKKGYTGPN